jgi:hypothetical protein
MTKIIYPSEAKIQGDFFSWLKLHERKHPQLALFFSVPNGTFRGPAARRLHAATGLKAGVPDCFLSFPTGRFHGLYIEFKSKTGRVSSEQARWMENLRGAGYRVELCRSWADAANVVIDYLSLPLKSV